MHIHTYTPCSVGPMPCRSAAAWPPATPCHYHCLALRRVLLCRCMLARCTTLSPPCHSTLPLHPPMPLHRCPSQLPARGLAEATRMSFAIDGTMAALPRCLHLQACTLLSWLRWLAVSARVRSPHPAKARASQPDPSPFPHPPLLPRLAEPRHQSGMEGSRPFNSMCSRLHLRAC